MAGDTKESVAIQTTSIIKSNETEEREKILTNFTKTLPIFLGTLGCNERNIKPSLEPNMNFT